MILKEINIMGGWPIRPPRPKRGYFTPLAPDEIDDIQRGRRALLVRVLWSVAVVLTSIGIGFACSQVLDLRQAVFVGILCFAVAETFVLRDLFGKD